MASNLESRSKAVNDFYRARSQATLKEIIAQLTGKSVDLLSYEEVRQKLRAHPSSERRLKDIPLDAIVGSVGRYTDFTRDFLPLRDSDMDRWIRVQLAAFGMAGMPPIDVYQLGDVYFVIDGNHRVSVARQMDSKEIQAYVTEVRSRVNITPDIQPDELIIKAEYAYFLEKTGLDKIRPQANLSITTPGKYPVLEEHIDVHRYFAGIEQKREIPYSEAVIDWYDNVYTPVIEAIQETGILRYFPGRTEADLYLWIAKYRRELEEQLGVSVRPETALVNLATSYDANQANIISRVGANLLDLIKPKRLESGPETGVWRKEILAVRRTDQLFPEILVPVDGKESGWYALLQASVIAQHEEGKLHGMYVVRSPEEKSSPAALTIQREFEQRCIQAGVEGHLVVTAGDITDEICNRARWADLVVTNLLHPPGPLPRDRLDSGFQELIQRCPRPILATPQNSTPLNRALLVYDGSPKAKEGLYIASYFLEQWEISLSVVTVFNNGKIKPETLLSAQVYLEEHGLNASYHAKVGDAIENIFQVAESEEVDFIIMGGYGFRPVFQVVLGSMVDQVLRKTSIPVLICR